MNWSLVFIGLFYLAIILIIIKFRKKFQIQAKIIALYKTKLGLKFMDKIAKKYPKTLHVLSYIGIYVGYIGLILISFMLIKNFFDLLFVPGAQSIISPVIPGVKIPKSVYVPFWYGIISIFIVATIHEFSHGVIARLHKVKVKSSGIVFFGPLIGAFVEPDEKQLSKLPVKKQLSILAAGPFSNILTAGIIFLILFYAIMPGLTNVMDHSLVIHDVEGGLPAELAGITPGETILELNGLPVSDKSEFVSLLQEYPPNKEITLKTDRNTYTIMPGVKNEKPYIGVLFSSIKPKIQEKFGFGLTLLFYFFEFLTWLFMLSLGIGLANLLPLGPVDGGRIMKITIDKFIKNKKKAIKTFSLVTLICVFLLIFSLFFPFVKDLIF